MPRSKFRFTPVTRHSLILVVAGLSYVALGLAIRAYIAGGPRWEALVIARNVMPLDSWGVVFIIGGIAVMIFAHWPSIARTWGYTILTGMTVGWAMFYFLGALFAPDPVSNLSIGFFWGLQGFVWWAISGLPDTTTWKVKMPVWDDE